MRRSIRSTLLFWYTVILTLVVGTFGGLLYQHRYRAVFDQIDAEIAAHAQGLAGTVEMEPYEGLDVEHAEIYVEHFDVAAPPGMYCIVLHPESGVLVRSSGAPSDPGVPEPGFRIEKDRREIVVPGPGGVRVVVGQRTESARRELAGFLSTLLGAGAATLLLALGGGWFLVGRLLRPIRRMTETAERISDANLSERIDIGSTESELGRLAETLNGAFDRLEAAFDRQTRFTADASHELRTPVSIVVSNAECGLRRDRTEEEYREALENCLRAGHRMTSVVEGLLVLTRADAGELDLSQETVDLGKLVRETADFLAPLAEKVGVAVSVDGDAEAMEVRGDGDRLRNALGNLISNAIRYNREGGRVDVSLSREGEEAVVTVADTGVGIPEEDRDRVFERFFRVDKARSRDAGGNGLGLPITRWIVEAHGGRISLTSEEGVGTEVTVRLPVG